MKLLEVKDLTKKDIPLHYRNEYSGFALFEMVGDKTIEQPFDFTIEHSPTGHKDIKICLRGALDYPLLPLIKSLRTHIKEMESKGRLP